MAKSPAPVDLDSLQNVEPARRRQLWDRLPGESERAFFAFTRFRDAAERRTVTAVARELTCSKQNVWKWSMRWRWEERAAAYDVHEDEIHRQEMARARTEMNKRQLRIGVMMQSIASHALAELARKVEQQLPLNMTSDEARTLMDTGVKLERQAVGEERQRGRYTQIIVRLGTLTDDDLVPDADRADRTEDDPLLLEGEQPKKVN